MQLREPLQDYFGTADKNALLDEEVYSKEDLREDKIRLKRQRASIQKEMDQYAEEYKKLLKKGAQADSMDRQRIAQQAKMAKKKYEIKKQQYKKNGILMGTVVTIEGARELLDMQEGADTNIEGLTENLQADEVQEQMMDQMIQFELDMDLMQEVQQSLDLDVMSTDMGMEGDDDIMETMDEMAAGEVSEEQIDLDEEVQVDTDDVVESSLDMDSDLEEAEDELGI